MISVTLTYYKIYMALCMSTINVTTKSLKFWKVDPFQFPSSSQLHIEIPLPPGRGSQTTFPIKFPTRVIDLQSFISVLFKHMTETKWKSKERRDARNFIWRTFSLAWRYCCSYWYFFRVFSPFGYNTWFQNIILRLTLFFPI